MSKYFKVFARLMSLLALLAMVASTGNLRADEARAETDSTRRSQVEKNAAKQAGKQAKTAM